ncbi:probable G-protein coupled receptor 179 [Rhea pennata]|uniref:probable G-protein coupled receptor 179 n=1 Tax=Rhea pennata TaxID=8795 RepID=UPI002E258448
MLLQANDIREASLAEDAEWYHALVRSLVAGDPRVYRAVLAFDAHPLASKPRLMLQATQESAEILLQDLSAAAGRGNLSGDRRWFDAPEPPRGFSLRKRLLRNDLRSLETPKWSRGDGYVGDAGHVRWSPPFLECRDGKFLPSWMVTLSSSFYGLKPDLSPEFKGVVRLDVKLQDVQLDPCASGPGWFADTHRCDLNSTQCVPQESRGFVLGSYLCRCKPGFYGAGGAAGGAGAGGSAPAPGGRLACRPCRPGCAACVDDAPCLIEEAGALRAAVLSCQAACMLAVFLSMLVSYHFRKSKRIRASGVILLETILFGSLLLYFPVFILYFKPSIFRCIVLRWVRGLGFAIVYGTIALKLYRVLKVFLSRTAQRVPYMSSGRVLKMLGLILLLVLWFLAAWTVGMLENVDRNIPLVIRSQTARGLQFHLCGHDRWDYMMVIAEMLFLLWGSFLCFATRSVPSAFHEPRYLGIALHNELLVSAAFHVARFVLVPSLHPDWTLLLFFAHTHATVTMTLVLLFVPKLLRAGSPLREEIAAEVYEDELDARRSGSYLNSSIASAWSERSLDPDDIREELKKLYAQLEAHRTRRMAASNPHLAKKRGSRRSLGRCALRRPAGPPEAERDGAEPAGRGGRGGGSLRLREGSRRRRAASLRKSRSAEDHARPPASPARKTAAAAAKASEPSDSESLEAAPLVCKSASAQELAAAGRPRRAPVRKALSLAAGAGHEAELPARPAAREKPARQERPGAPRDPGPPGSGGGGGSPRRGRARRHVTYAPVKSASADGALRPGRVRVAVRRTPPVPPARLQSLAPPAPPPAPAPGSSAPASPPRPREETCSGEQQAAGAAGSGTPRGASGPGTSAPRASLRSLGLALKAFSRSGGRRGGKGRGGGDGGSGGETPWAAAAASLRGPGPREEAGTAAQSAALGGSGGGGSPARENAGDARGKLAEEPGPASCGALRPARHEAPGPRAIPAPGSSREAAEPPRGATGPDRRDAPAEAAEEPEAEARKGTCPWEASEALPKTEGKEKEKEPADKRTTRPAAFASPGKALERGSGERAAVCPWESPGSAQPAAAPRAGSPALPGPPSRASQSPGTLKAEVCPWETRESEDGKAEICPWEVAAPPSDHGRAKQVPGRASKGDKRITRQAAFASPAKSLEGGSGERAAVCPGESPGSAQPAAGSLKAEVCPWEAQEGEGGSKAEICPWELAAPPPAREKLRRAEGGLPAGSKSTSPNQSVFKESTSEKEKGSRARGSVCPWESAGTEDASAVEGWKAASRKSESAGSLKAEVCPWESPDTEEPAAQPSRKPGSQRADVCPWETAGAAAGVRSDVCPWEGTGVPLDEPGREVPQRARAAGAFARLEFGSSQRESVCPWESMGAEEPSLKNGTGKGPSKGSKSTESRKSDICPWEEATEPKAVEKASVKADARPRGAAPASPAEAGKPVPGAGATSPTAPLKKSKGKAASEAEHKPLCRILPGVQPPRGPGRGSSPRAASLPASGSRSAGTAAVCPWEAEAAPPGPDKPSPGSSKPSAACPREAESADPIPARRGQGRAGESPGHGGGGAAQTDPDVCPWDHE